MEPQSPRLKNFAVSWFAVTIGLFGITITWSRAEHILHSDFRVSHLFLGLSVGVFILVVFQWKYFINHRFYLSWWAYSLPIAALTVATLTMKEYSEKCVYSWVATGLLTCLTVLIVVLMVFTTGNVTRRTICVEEEH